MGGLFILMPADNKVICFKCKQQVEEARHLKMTNTWICEECEQKLIEEARHEEHRN